MARASSKPKTTFALFLLGAFRLEARHAATTSVIQLPRRKVETLLAHLALSPNSDSHTREKLAALFWGDSSDGQARTSLRTSLAVIRKALGEGALVADRERVDLDPALPLWVDAREFESVCKTSPERAVELYGGELLPNCYDDWVLPERERLRTLYIETLLRLTQHMRSQSEYERALAFARQAIAADPGNEAAYQHAMFCEMARGDRTAALEQYAACVRALRDELAVEPSPETQALYHWIKQEHTLTASDAARITNLPIPLTSFIGRKSELGQAKSLLLGSRLLTLTGAGGSGKTRLSVQVAMEVMDQFRHGVWWVELAHHNSPALVPNAIAKALGVTEKPKQPPTETILQFLREKNLLLILDNCEHLIATCAGIAHAILLECAGVKILATSREPLNIPGETVWQVPTLTVPNEITTREELMMSFESVRLFVERARAVNAAFKLSEETIDAVTQICRRLDGIPLAIELAAARIAALSAQEIAARLDDRFTLLTLGARTALPRQQTLRALIDWSYDLLTPAERVLFRRLAVFSGGRTLAAAEGVCAFGQIAPPQILDLLTRLVSKSLLSVEPATAEGESRYGFLDTIKQYAREKLDESGEADETRARHLDYFLAVAERAAREAEGPKSVYAFDLIEREHPNLRMALRCALHRHDLARALRLANLLTEYWTVRGPWSEGREWFRQIFELQRREIGAGEGLTARSQLAWGQLNAAVLALPQGDLNSATELVQAGLVFFSETNDQAGIANAHILLGNIAVMQSNWAQAGQNYDTALAMARQIQNEHLAATALRQWATVAEMQGDFARARMLLESGLEVSRRIGEPRAIAATLRKLGNIAQQQGDYARAREIYAQAMEIDRAMGARYSIAANLTNIGNLLHSQGDYAAAQNYQESALKMMREIGDKRGIAIVLTNLGNALMAQGNFAPAEKMQNESLRLRRDLGDKRGVALTLGNLGDIALGLGKYDEAENLYRDGLLRLVELGDKRTMANCLIGIAQVAAARGEYARAAKLGGGIHALLGTLDAQIDTREQTILKESVADARAKLGQAKFEAASAEGARLTLAELVQMAERLAI